MTIRIPPLRLLLLLLLPGLAGCVQYYPVPVPVDPAASPVVTGAVLGAGTGALIGSTRGDAGWGAAVGAGIGALGGLLVEDQRRRDREAAAASAYGAWGYPEP